MKNLSKKESWALVIGRTSPMGSPHLLGVSTGPRWKLSCFVLKKKIRQKSKQFSFSSVTSTATCRWMLPVGQLLFYYSGLQLSCLWGRTGKSFQTKITFSYVCGDPIKTRIDVNTTTSFIVKNNQTKSNFVCQSRRFDLFTILVWCFFASFFNLRWWIIHLSFKVIELNRERRTQTVQMLIV